MVSPVSLSGTLYLIREGRSRSSFNLTFASSMCLTRNRFMFCCMKDARQDASGIKAQPSHSIALDSARNIFNSSFVASSSGCFRLVLSVFIGLILFKKWPISMKMLPLYSWPISHPLNWMVSSIITFRTLYLWEIIWVKLLRSLIEPANRILSVTSAAMRTILFLSFR